MKAPRFIGAVLIAAAMAPAAWAAYDPKGKRDPLIPLIDSEGHRIYPPGFDEEAPTGVQGLTLQGIVFDAAEDSDSYAILNGQLVRKNDEMEGMQVLEIGPHTVTIQAGGQKHQLTLQEPSEEGGRPTQKETPQP